MFTALVIAVWLAGLPIAAVAPQRAPAGGEGAVREVVKRYVEAREKMDAQAIAALFTDDADQLTSSGEWRRGRDAIVRGTLASSKRNAGTRTIDIRTVRFASADVAIADGEYTIAPASGGAPRRMWTSFVVARSGGAWRITAIRNMLPVK